MPIHILIVDDHAMVRQGLKMFLMLDPELEVVGEAAGGIDAVRMAVELNPDVILMDMKMPDMNGINAMSAIRAVKPGIQVIILTSVLEDSSVLVAMRAGAAGYIYKDAQADELCRAIRSAAAGNLQLSPRAAAQLVCEGIPHASGPELTDREREVLRLLAEGKANKEIAYSLHVGESTVKTHVSSILSKLGVPSRTQAALYATRLGL